MTLAQIKSAVLAGKTVYCGSLAYVVVRDSIGQWLIKCDGNCIGLTWADETTLNYPEASFFVRGAK